MGIVIVYITRSLDDRVIITPTLDNIDKLVFIDNRGVTYKYVIELIGET